jgi:hypothetical protein
MDEGTELLDVYGKLTGSYQKWTKLNRQTTYSSLSS